MRHRSHRSCKKRTITMTEVSMTPLIDTALTLLIIFMVAAPMMQNAIRISLPKGQTGEANTLQQELTVYVKKDGTLFFNGKMVSINEFIIQVKNMVNMDQEKTIFVNADQAVSYGTVIELVDQIKVLSGVKYVALSTKKKEKETSVVG